MDVDRGYAWVVMMADFGALFVSAGLLLCSGIIITTLQERFGGEVTVIALAGSLYVALSSLTGPISMFIISRTSCRITMMIGAALMAIGFLITAFSTNLNICLVSYGVIAGLGTGICYGVVFIVNGFHFKTKLNFANGVSMSGGGVGLFVLAPLLEKSKEIYGYPALFMLAAGTSLQLFVFGSLMRPSALEMLAKSKRNVKHSSGKGKCTDLDNYKKLLCDKATLCLIISYSFFSGGIYTAYMFWPSLCKEHGFSAMEASYFLSISGISAIVGRIVIGIVASVSLINVFHIYCVSLIALGVPCVLFKFYASSIAGQIINAVLLGTFSGGPIVVFADTTIQVVGVKYLPTAGGLQLLFGGVSSIVTPLVCGYAVNRGGSFGDTLVICGVCLLIGAALVALTTFINKNLVQETGATAVTDNMNASEKDSMCVEKNCGERQNDFE